MKYSVLAMKFKFFYRKNTEISGNFVGKRCKFMDFSFK